jgi:hypothetical protein
MNNPVIYDSDAYLAYPAHRKYFNKLWLSEQLGYDCGPAGVAPSQKGNYIVRPIYNLYGMGLGAFEMELGPDDADKLDPGTFWCEKFEGTHRSIDFGWKETHTTNWSYGQRSCFVGVRSTNPLVSFSKWYRDNDFRLAIPPLLHDIMHHTESYRIERWNIEAIDDKIIEVHLRGSSDPDYDEVIPVFEGVGVSMPEHRIKQYKFIKDKEDCGGKLFPKRKGFYVRNKI